MFKKINLEVDQEKMLNILKTTNGKLYRWSLGFVCVIPQPETYVYGDAPKAEWIGLLAFKKMVFQGLVSSNGELIPRPEFSTH